jgi:ethanolamine phosphate phosphodiesterase
MKPSKRKTRRGCCTWAWSHLSVRANGLGAYVVVGWLLLIVVADNIAFHVAISGCEYPTLSDAELESLSSEQGAKHVSKRRIISRLALIGDPQLTDVHSYGYLRHSRGIFSALLEHISDGYMQLCVRLVAAYHDPHLVVVLGDLLDSTRELDEGEYAEQVERFERIFYINLEPVKRNERVVSIAKQPGAAPPNLVLAPGNHDVGYALRPRLQLQLAEQFERSFGEMNRLVELGNNMSVVIVSPMHYERHAAEPSLHAKVHSFLDALDALDGGKPRVLVSHVPLWRPSDTRCGPEDPERTLHDRVGENYRNMMPPRASDEILHRVRPVAVFSGDDHRQCHVQHEVATGNGGGGNAEKRPLTEYTIGTFSWMQGNLWPSFALATAINPRAFDKCHLDQYRDTRECQPSARVSVCYLPPQEYVLYAYGALAAASLLAVVVVQWRAAKRDRVAQRNVYALPSSRFASPPSSPSSSLWNRSVAPSLLADFGRRVIVDFCVLAPIIACVLALVHYSRLEDPSFAKIPRYD